MCGIGGIKRFGDEAIPRESLEIMLHSLQDRGVDATGIALVNPDSSDLPGVHIFKVDEPAWKTTTLDTYKTWIEKHLIAETITVLLHTRAATVGSPRNNNNNHPMFKDRCAVVHNGGISNHDTLFKDMKLVRNAETDSDLLRAIVDKEGLSKKAVRDIARASGSVACAAIDPDDKNRLLLIRSGSPLCCAELRGFFIFASRKSDIYSAFRPYEKKFGLEFHKAQIPGVGWLAMRDDSAWIMGAKGLEWHDECKTAYNYSEPCRKVFQNYAERNAKWDDEAKRKLPFPPNDRVSTPVRIRCRNRQCNSLNKLNSEHQHVNPARLTCGECNQLLAT